MMPNIRLTEYQKLLQIKEDYERMREQRMLDGFLDCFEKALATYAASIPFEQWPPAFQYCFNHVAMDAPVAAALCLKQLPQSKSETQPQEPELKDYVANEVVGVQIGREGHRLWVCVDGIAALRVVSPSIILEDMRDGQSDTEGRGAEG